MIKELEGKWCTKIIKAENDSELLFMMSDSIYRMYHDQDCCEHVRIEDINGDLSDLEGQTILEAEIVTNGEEVEGGHQTWTFYKLASARGRVTIRWLGESNGYYSEGVQIEKYKIV